MSDGKTERRPKVLKVDARDAVNLGGDMRNAIKAELTTSLERTPSGVLVRYEGKDKDGKKTRRETFVPDSNIKSMDLEVQG